MSRKHSPESWAACLRIIDRLPYGVWWETDRVRDVPSVGIQALTGAKADEIRALLPVPSAEWVREWEEQWGWWSYNAIADGVILKIYAIQDEPNKEDNDETKDSL